MTRNELADVAWAFWQLQNEASLDEAFELLHPDGGYSSICADFELMPNASGQVETFIRTMHDTMTLRFERGDDIVEGDRVVLRFNGKFEVPGDDRVHEQSYCMIHTFRDGKIFLIEEFLDTKKEEPLTAFVNTQLEARYTGTADADVVASIP